MTSSRLIVDLLTRFLALRKPRVNRPCLRQAISRNPEQIPQMTRTQDSHKVAAAGGLLRKILRQTEILAPHRPYVVLTPGAFLDDAWSAG